MRLVVKPANRLEGSIRVPGDKSISHRAVMLGALAEGTTRIRGFLKGQDCLSTIRCFQDLGISINMEEDLVTVEGKGLYGLQEAQGFLYVGNSGTTLRLLCGILAGQPFTSFLTGDSSICRRPMGRVTGSLREMGAVILGRQEGNLAPLAVRGGELRAIQHISPVASAQVKSAIILAGLYADGWTEVSEPCLSRNHTELMLRSFGGELRTEGFTVWVKGHPRLKGQEILVPGDISSAAFFLVAGAIMPSARLVIEDVGLNPTRTGIIDVLQAMGAKLSITDLRETAGEEYGTLTIESSSLRGITIGGDLIPRLIDEIPVLAVAAAFADGVTEIRDAAELKVKESNRIRTMAEGLGKLGARIEELPDGLRIYGGKKLTGTTCRSYHDHRVAMSLAVAGLRAQGETVIEEAEAIPVSFPRFSELIEQLRKG